MARLDGKVAPITGAGTGIGRATARAMAAEGAKVVVAEIKAETGEQTAQIVARAGGDCIAVATDVTEKDSVGAAIDAAVRHYGGLHILHNNAGGSTPVDSTVVEVPIGEFWRAIRLDLFGTFLGCRFGIPAIIASGGGSVINMASNVALMGVAGRDCYTAAKGGIAAITRSMAVEFAPQRVRVNAIAPVRNNDRPGARPARSGQSAGDKARGGASAGADRTRGHRQYGGVPGFGISADDHRARVSGGRRG
jgi:NAD(P)-dependent dehydrogenase (short-subunit alcohol dehydrogenase family)